MLLKKTKKFMSVVLSMLFMVSILPAIPAFADYEGSCGEGVTYSFDRATGTLTISGNGKMNDYGDMRTIKGAPWNSYASSIKSVTIENGVNSIGRCAFCYCSGLTGQLTIPDSVTYIKACAFAGCSRLTGQLTIPDSVTYIGDNAFIGCSGLEAITIPSSVTSIGWHAFEGCSGLKAINVDESNTNYKSIDGILFSKDGTQLIKYPACKKDPCYTIPSIVTKIDPFAFFECRGLEAINVDESNTNYKSINGILFSKDSTKLIKCPAGKKDTCYTIPDSVTEIGSYAFYGCSGLKGSLTIPSSVDSIGDFAFNGCSGLTSVTISSSVTEIGEDVFVNCINLESVNYLGNTEPEHEE